MSKLLLALVCVAAVHVCFMHMPAQASKVQYQADKLNVHLIAHTHDDVGWLKTITQYYAGLNNTIQHAAVNLILDSVVYELQQDVNRRFIYVEILFFSMWWNEQNEVTRAAVKKLVANKQLVFINGGGCMSDEATIYYTDDIENMQWGHRWLLNTFGQDAIPRIGWHIDPFGHSSVQASLFAQMGFDGFFFGRIDYQDYARRKSASEFEYIWRGSNSLGQSSDIFSGVNYNLYQPPPGFCWDDFCDDTPFQDDPTLTDYNVDSRVKDFVASVTEQAQHYRGGHILLTMGSDFQYENAHYWFKNLDKLIKYVNARSDELGVYIFYSTPEDYLDAKHAANLTWTLKTDDLFPYLDGPHASWAGYFVSRPALKGYVRDMSSFVQMCKHATAMDSLLFNKQNLQHSGLAHAMAIAQHHDAVAGTEKQHVAYDYAMRLAIGESQCQAATSAVFSNIASGSATALPFAHCPLRNVSVCPSTEHLSAAHASTVLLYNELATSRSNEVIRVPVPSTSFSVVDVKGAAVPFQVLPLSSNDIMLQQQASAGTSNASYELSFATSTPATGLNTYFIVPSASQVATAKEQQIPLGDDVLLENNVLKVTVSGVTGRLSGIVNKQDGSSITLDQQWLWYQSSVGTPDDSQASGAYILRVNSTSPFPVSKNAIISQVYRGAVFDEIRQEISSWLYQKIRLYHAATTPELEIEYVVGPIPIADGLGKEVITRFSTSVNSGSVFYTDANGRDMQKRTLNYRPTWKLEVTEPIGQNYFPINAMTYLTDSKTRFAVVNDRSQGGASLASGQLEVMVHRRTLQDDSRGVGEPISEPGIDGKGLIIRGTHKIILSAESSGASHMRSSSLLINHPVRPVFAPLVSSIAEYASSHVTHYSLVQSALPANLHLQTLELLETGEYLIRIAHLYEVGEDAILSQPASVDLQSIFPSSKVVASVVEMNLSANRELSTVKRYTWNTAVSSSSDELPAASLDGTSVTLSAMQIRTFIIRLA